MTLPHGSTEAIFMMKLTEFILKIPEEINIQQQVTN